ncbi:MAG: site-specific DNA-methyltransferase [Sphingomonadaceae bacterium]
MKKKIVEAGTPCGDLEIVYRKADDLKPNPRNARTHTKKQIAQIAASIAEFGFTNPVLINHQNMVIAGHGRVEAAKLIGMGRVPTIQLGNLTSPQLRAYVIADNQLAVNAGWDMELLRLELGELNELDLDFDLTITGFDFGEIDAILDEQPSDPLDDAPAVGELAITRPGDVWAIGPHRLACGDARDAQVYASLLGDERARMVFTDPPYNVKIDGHVSGLGKVKHREFAMASGEMSRPQFTAFLASVAYNLGEWALDGSLHYLCMDFRHLREMLDAGEDAYDQLLNLIVWNKMTGGMGSMYRSQQELIFLFKKGNAPHINNVELGKHGRYRTNVWDYRGANSFGRSRDEDLAMHPTVKPVAMIADAILDATKPKEIVLDAFAGSGSTLAAAHKTKRRGYGIELDPLYCDVILKRMEKLTRTEPVHVATGLTFSEIAAKRGAEGGKPTGVNDEDPGEIAA